MVNCIDSRFCGAAFLALAVFSSGCGGPPARATVKGRVTLGDKPLTVGNVIFSAKDGKDGMMGTATIDKDGNYVLHDAPVGDANISVMVPRLPPGGLEMMRRMKNSPGMKESESVDPNDSSKRISIMGNIPENLVPIPDKYGDPSTSGLTYTVKSGEQTHDIKLTP